MTLVSRPALPIWVWRSLATSPGVGAAGPLLLEPPELRAIASTIPITTRTAITIGTLRLEPETDDGQEPWLAAVGGRGGSGAAAPGLVEAGRDGGSAAPEFGRGAAGGGDEGLR